MDLLEPLEDGTLGDLNLDAVLSNSVSVLPEDPSDLWSNTNIISSPGTPLTPFSTSCPSATEDGLTPPPPFSVTYSPQMYVDVFFAAS